MNKTTFELSFLNHKLYGDKYPQSNHTLVLHGAGKSSRAIFSGLREALYNNGIRSVSFDFIGHGETGGQLVGSSLRERTNQAAAVIREHCCTPITLIATSMSGYTAIKLTELFPVNNLILLVPAVYSLRAYDVAFGEEFSKILRLPYSWRESDAFKILSEFKGNLVIIAAESDEVIPDEIPRKIHAAAIKANEASFLIVPGSKHTSLFPKREDHLWAVDIITQTCNRDR